MDTNTTESNQSNTFSGGLVERLLYGLVTLIFCTAPFLIPGIDMRQGVAILFGATIILFFALLIFTLLAQTKTRRSRSK